MGLPYRSDFHRVEDLEPGLVWFVRTNAEYPDWSAFDREHDALLRALDGQRGGIVVDLREARGRNDPSFEARMAEVRRRMLAPFGRIALVVQSAIGRLQVQRHMLEDGKPDALVTGDPDEAKRYARGESARPATAGSAGRP